MPDRIQLRRTKGWRKPEGVVVVSRPTRWGNPWAVTPFEGGWSLDHSFGAHADVFETKEAATAEAVARFRHAVLHEANISVPSLDDIREHLTGRDLACWCPIGSPCHGDVLLELSASDATPNASSGASDG